MTTVAKHGLGRGLGALIPTKPGQDSANQNMVRQIPVAQIEPNPKQPRKNFTAAALDELAASIREHGIIQPLVVQEVQTPYGSRYQLIAGERRWRAAQRAGMGSVPALLKGATSQQMLELALVENVQRQDLNALEEADAYRQLIQEFELTQDEVAHKVGKDRSTISNALRLLKMPEALQEAVLNETIREGHARALMQIADEKKRAALLKNITEQDLSVRQTEEIVRRTNAKETTKSGHGPTIRRADGTKHTAQGDTHSIEEDLRRALGTKVELYRSQRGGKIIIEFYSDEELDAIYEKIVG